MSKYSGTETTMVPGTLRGYRVWRLTPYGLGSVSFTSYVWGRNEQARCAHGSAPLDHRAPVSGCTCGLYAKHTLEAVEYEFDSDNLMYGSIKAHGRIILGDHGFRAEHAEIEALLWYGQPMSFRLTDDELLKILSSVPFYTSRKKFLKDYPPISVDHLLPEKAPTTDRGMGWPYPATITVATVLDPDEAKLWLDALKLQADARRAYMNDYLTGKWSNE